MNLLKAKGKFIMYYLMNITLLIMILLINNKFWLLQDKNLYKTYFPTLVKYKIKIIQKIFNNNIIINNNNNFNWNCKMKIIVAKDIISFP